MKEAVAFQKNWPGQFSLDGYKKHMADFLRWSEQAFEQQSVQSLVKARARFIDQLLAALWQQQDLNQDNSLCLIAVGGYGRGELHPYSDIDLLMLSEQQLTPKQQDQLSTFITQLWDLKLEVGHSVRTLDETLQLGKDDITIATNLMEMRRLLGNKALYERLQQAIHAPDFWTSQQFFEAKRHEQQQRHAQYHGTAYNLEPNLKANPGGLRDIQTIGWVAKRHFQTRTMRELVAYQYLTEDEYQELMECEAYLWQMRFALHLEAGRNENRLLFDYQPAVAERLGFGSDGKATVERMMKRFFRTVQRVSELNEMLLQHFEGSILNNHQSAKVQPLDDSFELHGHLIKALDNGVFARRDNLLKLFWHIANNSNITGIHSDTLRLLRQVRRRLMGDLQDYEACRRLFLALMRHPRGMDTAITLMHKYGVLAAYLPQWRNIVGQMQFDLFHAYTVDEHTHRLLKNLYRYTLPEYDNEFPLCSDIVRRMEKPELLFLAGIFHDIAKGRGGDHSELGAMDAKEFCRLHKLSDFDSKLISWLVEQHLLMSVTAQRKDIHDPQVVTEFAEKVRDETRLNYLYCLTLADIRATNDNLWNDWKGSLLRDLYLSTQKAFRRGLEKPMDMRDQIRENQTEAMRLLQRQAFTKTEVQHLWSRIKADYFIRYNPKQIVWHCEHILRHKEPKQPLVLVSKAPIRGSTQVFVYTPDQPNLFARLVSALDSKKVAIFDAQIMTNKDGYAMDTFVVLEQNGQPVTSPSRVQSIKRALEQAIAGKTEPQRHSKLSRQMRQFNVPPKVSFLPGNSKNRTMVEIAALDAPGLLARIGDVFQQCAIQIHAAKITTLGERAEDFFMVSTADDTALDFDQQSQLKRTLIDHLTHDTEG
ncbi:bifunctional uridylyltransferase/uridylyl-removing protein GlnD [Alkalimonas sp. MEB108]|uniref:Bifunctional uridylyltransferase/uridylyl-removing enzyme n=1 Tax=Alkalimonas cellulosilytica TaxID=3058395 RepID=A0ABU7J5Q0_9GAMM|nr:bifunctional uridylyltransferase/uridylyl-removing protein GlnD [Alkalimonas sp. MEB108]MEE2001697.1 bifunctional uridylyltransferase/uridylyl-removing protein GlnD [Alkalimonas sp. MEB108]